MTNRKRYAALALTFWTLACTSHRPPPGQALPAMGRKIRVTSASPFTLGSPTLEPAPVLCRAIGVGGVLVRATGDTLILGHSRDIAPAADGSICPVDQSIALVLTPSMAVTEERLDRGRTMAALVAIGVAVAGFAALAVSLTEPPSLD
jgi:hypothetical protein